jgi:hypothetical protein
MVFLGESTKLTNGEISWISENVGTDWDKLGGLLNIPYHEREEIRFNSSLYPTFPLKAERILVLFNESRVFHRRTLKNILKELGRHDLEKELNAVGNQVFHVDDIFTFATFQE